MMIEIANVLNVIVAARQAQDEAVRLSGISAVKPPPLWAAHRGQAYGQRDVAQGTGAQHHQQWYSRQTGQDSLANRRGTSERVLRIRKSAAQTTKSGMLVGMSYRSWNG
jgi:hypothetical protein